MDIESVPQPSSDPQPTLMMVYHAELAYSGAVRHTVSLRNSETTAELAEEIVRDSWFFAAEDYLDQLKESEVLVWQWAYNSLRPIVAGREAELLDSAIEHMRHIPDKHRGIILKALNGDNTLPRAAEYVVKHRDTSYFPIDTVERITIQVSGTDSLGETTVTGRMVVHEPQYAALRNGAVPLRYAHSQRLSQNFPLQEIDYTKLEERITGLDKPE